MKLITKLLLMGPAGIAVEKIGKKLNEKRKEWVKEAEERRVQEAEQFRNEINELGDFVAPYYCYRGYKFGYSCAGFANYENGQHYFNLIAYVFFDDRHFCIGCTKRRNFIIKSSAVVDRIYSLYPMLVPIFLKEAFSSYDEPTTLNQWVQDFEHVLKDSILGTPTCKIDNNARTLKRYLSNFLSSTEDDVYLGRSHPVVSLDETFGEFRDRNINCWVERVMHYDG